MSEVGEKPRPAISARDRKRLKALSLAGNARRNAQQAERRRVKAAAAELARQAAEDAECGLEPVPVGAKIESATRAGLMGGTMIGSTVAPAAAEDQMTMTPDGPVLTAFMQDWAFVTIIRGPWGSGKSVACCGKLYMAACMQEPDRAGVRRSRWFVVRNTYPDLQETTVKTWLSWFPEEVYGLMRRSRPFQHIIRVPGPLHNGRPTRVEMEVLFLALDDEDDRKKLLSMEFTGGWVNEAREIAKPIIDDLIGRTGRFPSMRDGGPTWAGVIMDTNAPAETHWLPVMMGEVPMPEDLSEDDQAGLEKPKDWNYYVQPGALREVRDPITKTVTYEANPAAENTKYLKDGVGWYLQRLGGKTRSWIRVNFCNLLGSSVAGKPVWPTFSRDRHVAPAPIPFDPALHLYVGVDQTGRNPAAPIGQVYMGRWRIIGEIVGKDISSEAFAPALRRHISKIIAPSGLSIDQVRISFYRDPHNQRNDTDDNSSDLVYRKHGILLIPAPGGNGIKHRTETVEAMFDFDRILISPNCTRLIAACEGGYRFRKLNVSGEVYDSEPDKRNGHADIADGLQYLLLGAGEGRAMMKGSDPKMPTKTVSGYKPRQNRQDLFAKRQRRAG